MRIWPGLMLPGFGRSQKNKIVGSVFISLCFPLCPGQGRNHAGALILTLSLGDTKCPVPLTYHSNMWEPLYNPYGLGDKDTDHPVIGRAEQPQALLSASGDNTNKEPSIVRSATQQSGPVPKAEVLGAPALWPVLPSISPSFSSGQNTNPLSQCFSKYSAECSGRCLRH